MTKPSQHFLNKPLKKTFKNPITFPPGFWSCHWSDRCGDSPEPFSEPLDLQSTQSDPMESCHGSINASEEAAAKRRNVGEGLGILEKSLGKLDETEE